MRKASTKNERIPPNGTHPLITNFKKLCRMKPIICPILIDALEIHCSQVHLLFLIKQRFLSYFKKSLLIFVSMWDFIFNYNYQGQKIPTKITILRVRKSWLNTLLSVYFSDFQLIQNYEKHLLALEDGKGKEKINNSPIKVLRSQFKFLIHLVCYIPYLWFPIILS